MTWSDFYLVCFVVGFALSLLSFLSGGLHWHLPFFKGAAHGTSHGVHVHVGHAAPAHGGGTVNGTAAQGGLQISPFNFLTLTIFLAWFGGTGYLLTRYSVIWFALALFFALLSGLAGAAIVFWFMAKVLTSPDAEMDPADYEMVGVLGRISVPIRQDGTGEIVFAQGGTRHAVGARSENGTAIPKGSEVVVTQYEGGIAYVRLWDDMNNEELKTEN